MMSPELEDVLTRGVLEVIEAKHLELRLGRSKPLRVKLGIDPTGFQLHLGHAVALRKLAAFQAAGHKVVFIIGDYTARVGDPTGKDKTRRALTAKETSEFAATYIEQASKILDIKRAEIRYNSEWFEKMKPNDFIRLMTTTTVNQILTHETFRRRLDKGLPLSLHELIYPLLQGYDSVMVEADVELGAQEQKFNLLAGREVQRSYEQEPQDIMILDYLLGTDGKEKMSKTLNNYIALDDSAEEMFGKAMSIPDKAVNNYFSLATNLPEERIREIATGVKKRTLHPKEAKILLAKTIVAEYHTAEAAEKVAAEFTHVFSEKGTPASMPGISIKAGQHQIINLLVSHRLVTSRSEARRLIEQGGVKVDTKTVTDWEETIEIHPGTVIQIGKRKFVKAETD